MTDTDLLIIGGGINGAGIARDAAGRGLKVVLCEKGDLGGATSSASTKLIHGGLRYLEFYEFRMVREALAEREVLLRNAPHLIRPMRFVMPHVPALRPMWMMRLGLWFYDHLAGRQTLAASESIDLTASKYGEGLRPEHRRGLAYSDCWTDDARLVLANARSAKELGARVMPRWRFEGATLGTDGWRVEICDAISNESREICARGLVNAAGPWINRALSNVRPAEQKTSVRLVKGSHIVVPRLHRGDHALLLQNHDRRVIFVIPYGEEYSVIGTTDVPIENSPDGVRISQEEIEYLCEAVNRFFTDRIGPSDVLWSFSGVRPLHDDGEADPSKISRDYDLELQASNENYPLLNVYGGKLTIYRRLAEDALEKLRDYFPAMGPAWTERTPLPGGDLPVASFEAFLATLKDRYGFLPAAHLEQLARRHGSSCAEVLGDAATLDDLGPHFANGLYAREVDYLREHEWATTVEDILWRRTKCGLGAKPDVEARLADYLAGERPQKAAQE